MSNKLVTVLFQDRDYFKYSSSFGESARDSVFFNTMEFPSLIDKKKALDELKIIQAVFDRYDITMFLTHGSCLGAIREKDFIAHDSDIDIGCYKKDIDRIILAVKELRDNYEFKVIKVSLIDESIALIRDTVQIDINLYRINGKYWQSNKGNVFKIPLPFLEKLKEIEFLEMAVLVPSDTDAYLLSQYGKDWKKPISDFYSPYRRMIEQPLTHILKYIMGERHASRLAKRSATLVQKLRAKMRRGK